MASLTTNKKTGSRILQFINPHGKRKTIHLGPIPKRDAEEFKRKLELLLAARLSQLAPERHVSEWLAGLGLTMLKKLVATGALSPEQPAAREATTDRLGEFLDAYELKRTDVGKGTTNSYKQTSGLLNEYFGRNKPLKDVTEGDADEFRAWLLTKVGDNTARRHCGRAKQFFRAAHRKKLIAENPFGDMKGTSVRENRSREYFLSLEDSLAVLDACPDLQWRLIFALARFGGLRTPSETLLLKLADVDWARNKIRITSPKTAHHEGHEERFIPIFPELRPLLLEAAEAAEPGTEYFITKHRQPNCNLRTQFERIIKRAGLKPWPKLFQNLRSTRETELAKAFPIHVVCRWLGNSQLVAAKHYLQLQDSDFASAAGGECSIAALQSALLHTANTSAQDGTTEGSDEGELQESPSVQPYAVVCSETSSKKVRLRGFEPPTYGLGNRCSIP
jgi:integrase